MTIWEVNMLRKERHRIILDEITQRHKVVSAEISVRLQTSEDTIRRDLNELARAGRLVKVHGGALPLPVAVDDTKQRAMTLLAEGLEILLGVDHARNVKVLAFILDISPLNE